MKRRRFITAIAAIPAAAVVSVDHPSAAPAQTRGQTGAPAEGAPPTIPVPNGTIPDTAAAPVPKFFTGDQFAALEKLGEVLVPPRNGVPGAVEAGAPAFLDFFISTTSRIRQDLYRKGLDDLNTQARTRFKKPFAELERAQVDAILAPLFKPYGGRRSPVVFGPFVNEVRTDLRTATNNSPAASAAAEVAGRPVSPIFYWRNIDPTILPR